MCPTQGSSVERLLQPKSRVTNELTYTHTLDLRLLAIIPPCSSISIDPLKSINSSGHGINGPSGARGNISIKIGEADTSPFLSICVSRSKNMRDVGRQACSRQQDERVAQRASLMRLARAPRGRSLGARPCLMSSVISKSLVISW